MIGVFMTRKVEATLFLFTVFCNVWIAGAAEFYVSPSGDDRNPGTISQPFATLEAAKKAVRVAGQKQQGTTVYLRGGTYVLDETLVFGLRDSAPEGAVIRYMAYSGETPVVSSLKAVDGWKKLSSPITGLPAEAQGNVWVADVGAGRSFKVLYGRGEMLPRAKSKGFLPVQSEKGGASVKRLTVPDSVELRKWENFRDVEVLIRPLYPWSMNILPVADVDVVRREVTTTVGGTYPLEPPPQPFQNVHELFETCWFENAVDFLDAPGEWVLDSAAGKLYLWPADGQPPADIAFPQCVELIRIEGKPQEDQAAAQVVRGLEFNGITFTGNDRYTWQNEEPSYQHDWSAVDQASAMFRLRYAEDCVVEDCRFVQGGTTGIRLDLQAQNNRIEGNRFSELGEHGIALCGYGPGTKDVNKRNEILNNRIDHIGKFYWAASGIYIAQSGENRVANNLIHNVPFIGITLSGARDFNWQRGRHGEGYRSIRWGDISDRNKKMLQEAYRRNEEKTDFFLSTLHARDNLIDGNEIFAAVEVLGDGNAIYLSGAGTGNRIRRNYIHHILSDGISTAMRPDDLQEQTTFEDNIVYKCVFGAVEHKHQNHYINNIFACIYPTNIHGLEFRDWGYFIFGRGPNTGSRVQNNIFYGGGGEPRFVFARPRSPMEDSLIDNNLYWYEENPKVAEEQLKALQAAGHERRGLVADPQFADIEKGDFSIPDKSPALGLGFRPIDMASIGLQSPWKEKLVGTNLMHTRISPSTHYINPGDSIRVTIECSQPDAEIRYTLDGREPDERSTVYESALRFSGPVYIRAKAFKKGAIDLYGAAEFFTIKGDH
jgi:hypothetical protein